MDNYNMEHFQRQETQGLNQYLTRTFGWMFIGLMVTFAAAVSTAASGLYLRLFNGGIIFIITILELVLVTVLSARLNHLEPATATLMFLGYALLNGLVFSTYFVVYDLTTLVFAFLASAIYFGAMAVYGMVTKRDLSGWAPKLFGGLMALLVVGALGFFLHFAMMDLLLCAGGLVLFMAYTAFDTQRVKAMYYATGGAGEMAEKLSIMGALRLYLDFINIFVRILALFGRNSRRRR